jgi:cardiolipin synthase
MNKQNRNFAFYLINGITLYRLVSTVLLVYLVYARDLTLFKWLLAFSFFTDSIDGRLARKFRVVSVLGSRLDSIADDLTVLVSLVGLYFFRHDFLKEYFYFFLVMVILYIVQVSSAMIRYGKFTSFHTWSAKISFVFQGVFLILVFFLPTPPMPLFYLAMAATAVVLIEETILVFMLPEWKSDVKGIYWVLKEKKKVL